MTLSDEEKAIRKKCRKEIGRNIKEARDNRSEVKGSKYTQSDLAKEVGCSQSFIGDIETGKSPLPDTLAIAIASACNVSVDFILRKEEEEEKEEEKGPVAAKPKTLDRIKDCLNEFLDIVYLPVVGRIPAGVPLLEEENIETYLPYPKEYDPQCHFVLRVSGDSMKDANIFDGDLVVIRQQPTAENGKIVAVRLQDNGVTLKKFYRDEEKIILKPCNEDFKQIELTEDVTIIGIAVSITKKLA